MKFPKEFWWGASTSSYQIEGHNRGSAFWDWERKKGWEPSGAACDSWNLWREDIRCLKELSLNTYRYSIEWSRVETAPGIFDEEALGRYAEMTEALARAGIRPVVCLHHFSEPAWLASEAPQGWRSDKALELFVRFSARVAKALKPWVRDWITFNEPMVFLVGAYGIGVLPPGRLGWFRFERDFLGPSGLIDRAVRAHVAARAAIKEERPDARVGLAHCITELEPAREGTGDVEAARDWDVFMHRRVVDGAVSAGALDFMGINYYTRVFVTRVGLPGVPLKALPGYAELERGLGPRLFKALGGRRGDRERTGMDWEIVPEGFERVVLRAWQDYRIPIVIMENGLADDTGLKREPYLRAHLAALGRAMNAGAQVFGYLHWSLLDNYEWGSYRPKFGLFHVNRRDGFKRTRASGADFYAQVARTGELPEP